MNIEQLKLVVPAAFADHPASDVSSQYEFISTYPIVEQMLARGWTIREAHQNRKQVDAFASHRIVFDVPTAPLSKEVGKNRSLNLSIWNLAQSYLNS